MRKVSLLFFFYSIISIQVVQPTAPPEKEGDCTISNLKKSNSGKYYTISARDTLFVVNPKDDTMVSVSKFYYRTDSEFVLQTGLRYSYYLFTFLFKFYMFPFLSKCYI